MPKRRRLHLLSQPVARPWPINRPQQKPRRRLKPNPRLLPACASPALSDIGNVRFESAVFELPVRVWQPHHLHAIGTTLAIHF